MGAWTSWGKSQQVLPSRHSTDEKMVRWRAGQSRMQCCWMKSK